MTRGPRLGDRVIVWGLAKVPDVSKTTVLGGATLLLARVAAMASGLALVLALAQ